MRSSTRPSSKYTLLSVVLILALLISYIVYDSEYFINLYNNLSAKHTNTISTIETSQNPQTDLEWGALGTISPPNLPSIRISPQDEAKIDRAGYGGKGDKPHLGGFTATDPDGLSNNTFNFMLGPLGIRSIVDVGCGKGVSTSIFRSLGAKVLCVEGSHDAVQQSLLPSHLVVEHDFSRGPWWPNSTFDAVWCVELLEHIGRQYMANYVPIFRRAALLMVTHSAWGGWHHVEVHPDWWWKMRFEALGFRFSPELTTLMKDEALRDQEAAADQMAQHIKLNMLVFINPAVASLPRHRHLMAGFGCFNGDNDHDLDGFYNKGGGIRCDKVDELPVRYQSLLDCKRDVANKKALWLCVKNKDFSWGDIGADA